MRSGSWSRRHFGPTPGWSARSWSFGIGPTGCCRSARAPTRSASSSELVERGELDQEQHDAVRDVFCAPGGCTLVRADLFASLGGFDPEIDLFGDDLNLSWRAQVAGARVLVVPEARVRHTRGDRVGAASRAGGTPRRPSEPLALGRGAPDPHPAHLLRPVPPGPGSAPGHRADGGPGRRQRCSPGGPAGGRHPPGLAEGAPPSRLAVAGPPRRPDPSEGQRHRDPPPAESGQRPAPHVLPGPAGARPLRRAGSAGAGARRQSLRAASWQLSTVTWAIVAAVLLVGTRGPVGPGHCPGSGSLPVLAGGPSHWWRRLWFSGWRPDGLGSAAPAPPGTGPARRWPARSARERSAWCRSCSSSGRCWSARWAPTGPPGPGARRWAGPRRWSSTPSCRCPTTRWPVAAGPGWSSTPPRPGCWPPCSACRATHRSCGRGRTLARLLGLGLLVAVTAAFVPATLFVVPLIGVGLLAGSVLTGRITGGLRALAAAVVATAIAAALLLPWSADVLGSRTALFGVEPGPAGRLGLGTVLRLPHRPDRRRPPDLGAGRGRGPAAAHRPVVAPGLGGPAVGGGAGVLGRGRGPPAGARCRCRCRRPRSCWLRPRAALAGAVALGCRRLRGRPARVPLRLAPARLGGRGRRRPRRVAARPGRGRRRPVAPARRAAGRFTRHFSAEGPPAGAFRVLWVGDPRTLPLGAWPLEAGVGYATSESGMPDVTNQWPARSSGATPLLATDLRLARDSQTTAARPPAGPPGRALHRRPQPGRAGGHGRPAEPDPERHRSPRSGLQVDLRTVQADAALTVYENAAWAPERAVLPSAAIAASRSASPEAAQAAPLAGARPVLVSGSDRPLHAAVLPGPADVVVSATATGAGNCRSAADRRPSVRPSGGPWPSPSPARGGNGVLRFRTPATRDPGR